MTENNDAMEQKSPLPTVSPIRKPVAPEPITRNILYISKAQRDALALLNDEQLRRFQSAFDAIVYVGTDGLRSSE
jgi:hypothetical protein